MREISGGSSSSLSSGGRFFVPEDRWWSPVVASRWWALDPVSRWLGTTGSGTPGLRPLPPSPFLTPDPPPPSTCAQVIAVVSSSPLRPSRRRLHPHALTCLQLHTMSSDPVPTSPLSPMLPGKSFASNEYVWLSNAQSADRKLFHRALIAKTIVCVPFIMHGVLELGTTDPVSEDPALVDRITASLWDTPPRAAFSSEAGVADIVVFEDLDHGNTAVEATTTMVPGEPEPHAVAGGEVAECESNAHNDLEQITMDDIGELYSLCEELDVLDDDSSSWVADPWSSFQLVPTAEATDVDDAVVAALGAIDGSCRPSPSSFVAWKRTPDSDEVQAVPLISGEPPQKLLKKAVAGAGAWMNNADGSAATMTTDQGSSIKNHVMSERRRREKLKEMFLILKSVDKASILAETIAYLKELEKRVEELESSSQPSPRPMETTRRRCCKSTGKKVSAGARAKRKAPAPEDTDGERRHCVSNVNVTIMDNKELLLELQCQWKELLMTRVFDAIKGVSLDVLSVQASTSDGLLGLKIQAKVVVSAAKSSQQICSIFASPAAVEPGMITEALRKAIAS
ncbi:Os11g0258700 [Oryza sativa Japonica Group]|uniref:Os11g0258700 protein n=1 Tax=Oryza sativa subsp. japonica TaxID=39947 RepID=Q0ITG5_ORYSJ|nr:Os11g0258700 [Oryza sativa Japonica Group]|eukprot:NP_001067642.2 Os11g0258700 [Oryza sativa Japonica Group]